MRRVGLSTKLMLTVGILATLITTIAAISIGLLVYLQTEQQIQDQLTSVSHTIINEYLMGENGNIVLQKKDEGQSLVTLLRNMDMSLYLTDQTGKAMAKYGLYRTLEEPSLQILFSPQRQNGVTQTSGGIYEDKQLSSIGRVDTYTIPLRYDGNLLGFMQLTRINYIWPIIGRSLLLALLIQLPITWLAAIFVIQWGTKLTLSPLGELVAKVESLDIDHLPETILLSSKMDHDVGVLHQTLSVLIARIRSSLDRQKEIAQNLSHEFKTPLTRVNARLSMIMPFVTAGQQNTLNSVMKEMVGLGQQVDGLLDLAIHESSASNQSSWLLQPLLTELVETLPTPQQVTMAIPDNFRVTIPLGHARTLWRNILDNAAKYGPREGTIEVHARETKEQWSVSVSNAATQSSPSTKHVFLRYYRGIVSQKIQGHGLGMAIVRDLCKQLKLEVRYVTDDPSRIRVEVSGKK